jgi:hypothetical protein
MTMSLSGCVVARLIMLTSLVVGLQAHAETVLILSDLQLAGNPAGQLTQPGWFAQDVIKLSGTTSLPLNPTASGSSAGIAAALIAGGQWESRGGSAEGRDPVTGTTFNDVVSDLWVTRTMSFTMDFSGLSTGATYGIRTWHNDSYNSNAGFAAGGGIVQLSASGATVVSSTSGTVTNLRGAQTDSAFGIASIQFTPTVSNPQITFTRVGGAITALPVNGVEMTATIVPEPATCGMLVMAGVSLAATARRRLTAAGCSPFWNLARTRKPRGAACAPRAGLWEQAQPRPIRLRRIGARRSEADMQ